MVINGGASDGASSLVVGANQTVNYKIIARLANVGTVNNTSGQKITKLVAGKDGLSQLRFNIQEGTSDQIKVDITSPVTLQSGFDAATFSSTGTSQLRTSSTLHNLNEVKAVQDFGVFVGVSGTAPTDVVLASGSFVVKSLGTGAASNVFLTFGNPDVTPGVFKINGGTAIFPQLTDKDPLVSFMPLTLKTSGGGGGSTGSISGTLFNDSNKDGKFDSGDSALSNRKAFIDANNNGKLDSGEKTATTNSSGVYTFSGLAAGTYIVRRGDTPTGYSYTEPVGGAWTITLAAGQNVTGKDIGVVLGSGGGGGGGTGSIAGTLFNDANKDGKFDSGDSALSNRKAFIDANKNGKLDSGEKTATTNSSGVYTFTGLAAGTYVVRRGDTPAGYSYTVPVGGAWTINLSAGQNVTGKDIGVVLGSGGGGAGGTASISGRVFNDSNKNGKFDSGESLLSNRRIYIDKNKDGKLDTGDISVLSNSSGVYTFSGLAAGEYIIRRADTPSNYKITDPASGFYDIKVTAGQKVTGKDIGAALK